jgi:hypothetical protein
MGERQPLNLQLPSRPRRLAHPGEPSGATSDASLGDEVDNQPIRRVVEEEAAWLELTCQSGTLVRGEHAGPAATELDRDAGAHQAERVHALAQGRTLAGEKVPGAFDDHGRRLRISSTRPNRTQPPAGERPQPPQPSHQSYTSPQAAQ